MKVRVHADDLGASVSVTQNILRCHDEGLLESASLLVTGEAAEYASELCQSYPQLKLSLHLNIIEGRPLTEPSQIPLLVNDVGCFHGSIAKLLLPLFSSQKKNFLDQIALELHSQFTRFRQWFPKRDFGVDGHLHLHLLPFVFPLVASLSEEFEAVKVRLPKRFYFLDGFNTEARLVQLVKEKILTLLSARYRSSCNLAAEEALLTGVISPNILRERVSTWQKHESLVLLFHPGSRTDDKSEMRDSPPQLRQAYFQEVRRKETDILLSSEFSELLDQLRAE